MRLNEFDKRVSILAESAARRLSRRRVVLGMMKGVFAAVAATTLGAFVNIGRAFAIDFSNCQTCNKNCTCHWIPNSGNANCPSKGGCPPTGCPSGCSPCTGSDSCGGWCIYSDGAWCACNCLGVCGNGYRVCIDCKCSSCSGYLCTCLSQVICPNCCRTEDIEEEMRRVAASLLNAA